MKVDITTSIVEESSASRTYLFHELSNALNEFIFDKNYGSSIQKIRAGFLVVRNRPGYENWYKPRRISYIDHKITKSKLTGELIETTKLLKIETRLSDDSINQFMTQSDEKAKLLILQYLIAYFENINKLPSKITEFDLTSFKKDLHLFSATL